MSEAYRILGTPRAGGVLVVSDHASNRVPEDIDLGIDPALLDQHIAVDIGVAGVAELLVRDTGCATFLGNVSRLVCDFNRDEHQPAVIPIASDGHAIPGNALDHEAHEERLVRFFRPYHDALEALLADHIKEEIKAELEAEFSGEINETVYAILEAEAECNSIFIRDVLSLKD